MWPLVSGFSHPGIVILRYIHIVAWVSTQFLCMVKQYSIIHMDLNLSIHSSVDTWVVLWNECLCPCPQSYVETLIPNVVVLVVGAFGWCLVHKDETIMNGFMPYKRGSREIPCPFYHVRARRAGAGNEWGRGPSPKYNQASAFVLNLAASGAMRNEILLFISYLVCGILL